MKDNNFCDYYFWLGGGSGVWSKEEDKCHLKEQRIKCGGRMKKGIDDDNACTLDQISNFLDSRAH